MTSHRDGAGDHAGRRLVRTFFVTQTLGYLALFTVFPVVLAPMATALDATRTQVALASTVATLTGAAAAVPVGRLLDRSGGRLTMTLGATLSALGTGAWAFTDSLVGLYAAFALIGLGQAMSTYETAFAVLVASLRTPERQRAILAVTTVAGVATYGLSPVFGWLEVELGWRTCVGVLAVALATTAVPGHLLAVPGRALHRSRAASTSTGPGVRRVLREPTFWSVTFAFTVQTAATTALMALLVTHLRDVGWTTLAATTMPLVVGAAQVVARLLVGRAGNVRLAPVCVGAFAVQAAGLLLLPLAGLSVGLTAACVAAVGVGSGIGVIARPVVLADSFGTLQFATVLAVMAVPVQVARAFSPLVAAWLDGGRFLVVFGLLSALAALAMLPAACRRAGAPADDRSTAEPSAGLRAGPAPTAPR